MVREELKLEARKRWRSAFICEGGVTRCHSRTSGRFSELRSESSWKRPIKRALIIDMKQLSMILSMKQHRAGPFGGGGSEPVRPQTLAEQRLCRLKSTNQQFGLILRERPLQRVADSWDDKVLTQYFCSMCRNNFWLVKKMPEEEELVLI